MDIKEFLIKKYFAWQMEQGRPCTQTEFAEWLGVRQQSLSNWMRGDYGPRKLEDISKLANKLGFEVYNVLGLAPPLPAEIEEPLARFLDSLTLFPEEARVKIFEAMVDTVEEVIKDKIGDDERRITIMFIENIRRRIDQPAETAELK